jgi:outer membrane autotransporter protein
VIDLGSFGVIPRFALDRAHVEIDGYTETNGPAALVVPSRSTNFGTASLGGTVYTTLDAGGMKIYPRLSVSAVQGLNDRTDVISGAAFASSPGTLFRPISGVAQDDQWLDVGAGVDVRLSDSIAISADYEVDVDRKEVETRTLRLTGKVRF